MHRVTDSARIAEMTREIMSSKLDNRMKVVLYSWYIHVGIAGVGVVGPKEIAEFLNMPRKRVAVTIQRLTKLGVLETLGASQGGAKRSLNVDRLRAVGGAKRSLNVDRLRAVERADWLSMTTPW